MLDPGDYMGWRIWRALVEDWLTDHPEASPIKAPLLARQYADRAMAGGGPEDGYGREVGC